MKSAFACPGRGPDQRAIHGLEGSGNTAFRRPCAWDGTRTAGRTVRRRHAIRLQPHDPLTLVLAMSLLAAVAVASSYLPARRASRLDPIVALREE